MRQYLVDLIRNSGPIGISDFMNQALFHPKFGYYNQQNPFGSKGDFITSPEISQVFGELIGIYLVNIWQNHYSNQKIHLVEMGAGRGTMMKDLLNAVSKIPDFQESFFVHIIEISPKLQEIQKQNLQDYQITWWENFADFYQENHNQPIFFIANELFDCFAIDQFIKTEKGWQERLVTIGPDDKLHFALDDYNQIIDDKINQLTANSAEVSTIFEYSKNAVNFMDELSSSIKNSGGIGIIIDYGYIENQFKETLQAVKNHQYCDVLKNAGDADITALVNFKQLNNIAKNHQLQTSLITQKQFLESLGIELRRQKLILNKTIKEQEKINSAIDRLINPNQMGELFKTLIFWN